MNFALLIGTIVSLLRLFGAVEDSGTISASMVPKLLLLLCAALTSAQPVSGPKSEAQSWTTSPEDQRDQEVSGDRACPIAESIMTVLMIEI